MSIGSIECHPSAYSTYMADLAPSNLDTKRYAGCRQHSSSHILASHSTLVDNRTYNVIPTRSYISVISTGHDESCWFLGNVGVLTTSKCVMKLQQPWPTHTQVKGTSNGIELRPAPWLSFKGSWSQVLMKLMWYAGCGVSEKATNSLGCVAHEFLKCQELAFDKGAGHEDMVTVSIVHGRLEPWAWWSMCGKIETQLKPPCLLPLITENEAQRFLIKNIHEKSGSCGVLD